MVTSEGERPPWICIDSIAGGGGSKAFSGPEDVLVYIAEVRNRYSWLAKALKSVNLQTNYSEINQQLTDAESGAKEAKRLASAEGGNQGLEGKRRAVQAALRSLLVPPLILDLSAPELQYVESFRGERGDPFASLVLLAMTRPGVVPLNADSVRAFTQAELYREMTERRVVAEHAAVQDANAAWRDAVSAQVAEHQALMSEVRGELAELSRQSGELEQLASRQEKRFDETLEAAKGALEGHEEFFRTKMALKAPVDYWSNRARQGRIWATVWGALFFLAILGLGLVLWEPLGGFLFPGAQGEVPSTAQIVAVFVAVLTLAGWPLRIFSRLFLSNVDVWSDSKERVTMAQTYLALVEEGAGPSEAERHFIFEALFRPSRVALGADDSMPATFSSIPSKVLGK